MPKIVRILSVTDTRQWDDAGGKWAPIPGSGEEHACDRCGRRHEVWAQVLLDDDSQITVGTGCAKQEAPEVVREMARRDRSAKRLRRLQHELVQAQDAWAHYQSVKSEVDALPAPEVEFSGHIDGGSSIVFRMGDETVWQPAPRGADALREIRLEPHRREALEDCWRRREMARRGWVQSPRYWLSSIENEIQKIHDATTAPGGSR